jgi:hypothetical protein
MDGLKEAYFRHTQALLAASESRDETWRAARGCLHQRGFDLRKLEQLPVGYFPAADLIWRRLLHDGFAADEIRASNLLADSRLPGRLVGPIRDISGRITSFWARLPQQLQRCLYLSTDWKEQAGVFGLDVAHPAVANGRHDLLLVEDIWDAILIQAHGFSAVAAIGNSAADVSPRRWERLDEQGIHRVTLVVDSFRDSHEAAIAAIRQAAYSRRSPVLYVLPPAAVHGAWQSWQQGRSADADTLDKLLAAHRIHGFHYFALSLIALHKGEGSWTETARHAALAETRKFYAAAHQRNVPQLDAFFLPPLLEALGLTWSDRSAWLDSWLEDQPSANGSDRPPQESSRTAEATARRAQAESPCPGGERDPGDERGALDREASLAVVEPVVLRDLPDPASLARRHGTSEYCEFHQCERIVCLCWD